ncbi:MAG: DUF4301 family protein [Candidatus Delongbacteria bacterium]|nr:DUF4301 family protein [Candidatus Delongbacteria bacterium]
MYEFTEKDIQKLQDHGISPEEASAQIEKLTSPPPFADIISPATPANGIKQLSEEDKIHLLKLYKHSKSIGRFSKFVPASGAATRMFKDLIISLDSGLNENAKITMRELRTLPFFEDLNNVFLSRNLDIEAVIRDEDWNEIIECILYEKGLNYSAKPKALLKFTRYEGYSKTALEEHIYEARNLFLSEDRSLRLHFTFPEDFIKKAEEVVSVVREEFPSTILTVDFSVQKSSTDTLAVYEDGEPVRDEHGDLVLRPGGHGALIENLNETDADIVLIKNIDNIVNKDYRDTSDEYNMLLCGYLIDIEDKIKFFTDNIDTFSFDIASQVNTFLKEYFKTDIMDDIQGMKLPEMKKYIYDYLNRPLRVCGMLKNTGEPGGGPFFVRNKKGTSLQIVESSQINMKDPEKKKIFENSTHFNPVNIVCTLKDRKGKKTDLKKYIDNDSYFISDKTYEGKNIKALELPGLWNGGMSDWLTVFIEVPLETFCPAKTVNDLLRKERYPKDILEAR